MTGDCDDFAVMIAGYSQEHWGYDSFVALLDDVFDVVGHAVAFVSCDLDVMEWRFEGCGRFPYWETDGGYTYMPVDFHRCPGWHWLEYGGRFRLAETCEWDSLVGEPMSLSDALEDRSRPLVSQHCGCR
jgi:hypothetical protein